jgi:hypothetical protein
VSHKHSSLSVRITRSVSAFPLGWLSLVKGLQDTQGPAGPHQGCGGGLAPIVAHQRQALAANGFREVAIDGPIQGQEPMLGLTMHASIVAHAHLGRPIAEPCYWTLTSYGSGRGLLIPLPLIELHAR